jgi:hypothetical protein
VPYHSPRFALPPHAPPRWHHMQNSLAHLTLFALSFVCRTDSDAGLFVGGYRQRQLVFTGLRPRLASTSGDGTHIVVTLGRPLPLVDKAGLLRWQSAPTSATSDTTSLPPPVDAVTMKITSPGVCGCVWVCVGVWVCGYVGMWGTLKAS